LQQARPPTWMARSSTASRAVVEAVFEEVVWVMRPPARLDEHHGGHQPQQHGGGGGNQPRRLFVIRHGLGDHQAQLGGGGLRPHAHKAQRGQRQHRLRGGKGQQRAQRGGQRGQQVAAQHIGAAKAQQARCLHRITHQHGPRHGPAHAKVFHPHGSGHAHIQRPQLAGGQRRNQQHQQQAGYGQHCIGQHDQRARHPPAAPRRQHAQQGAGHRRTQRRQHCHAQRQLRGMRQPRQPRAAQHVRAQPVRRARMGQLVAQVLLNRAGIHQPGAQQRPQGQQAHQHQPRALLPRPAGGRLR